MATLMRMPRTSVYGLPALPAVFRDRMQQQIKGPPPGPCCGYSLVMAAMVLPLMSDSGVLPVTSLTAEPMLPASTSLEAACSGGDGMLAAWSCALIRERVYRDMQSFHRLEMSPDWNQLRHDQMYSGMVLVCLDPRGSSIMAVNMKIRQWSGVEGYW
eukprot:5563279-Ditylum_brightwellii.AAC.1